MRVAGGRLDLRRPLLVGILNLTPDSFSDGGLLPDLDAVVDRAAQLVADGADLLDLGGESTRPGATEVSADQELERVTRAMEALAARFEVPLSIDTRRATVAAACTRVGASMVNDVSGFSDPDMASVVASSGAGWVLMHAATPVGQMRWSERAGEVPGGVAEGAEHVAKTLQERVMAAVVEGVAREQLAVDPGIGFGKSHAQNLGFLRGFGPIARLGLPVYVGPSRKSFIGRITGRPAHERQMGTAAAVTAAVLAGAAFVRVHDVAMMRPVVDVATAIRDAGELPEIAAECQVR